MKGENNLLFLATGSSIGDILKKFGSFDTLYDHNPNKYFSKVIFAFIPAAKTQWMDVRDDVAIFDYRTYRWIYPLSILVYILKVLSIIRKNKVTLIRSSSPYIVGLIGLIVSKLTRIPYCVSIHADYDQRYKISKKDSQTYFGSRKIAKVLEKFVLSHTKMVLPIRESLGEYSIRSGAKPESIRVIPHGINLDPFLGFPNPALKGELGIEGKKVISFVGRLSGDNYTAETMEIAFQVCQQRNDTVFLIVGDGTEREKVEVVVEAFGLTDSVKLLGYVPLERVAQIRAISDVSLCLMAGFSLIEAAASSSPLISYDVEWHYELVKSGVTGFLVPEGDREGAVRGIHRLLDNPTLAKEMGENARKLAIEKHSIENTSRIKIKWYKELLCK